MNSSSYPRCAMGLVKEEEMRPEDLRAAA